MNMGPIKQKAINHLRTEVSPIVSKMRASANARKLMIDGVDEEELDGWLDRIIADDKAAWDAVMDGYGMWAALYWEREFPTANGTARLSSWTNLIQWGDDEVIEAENLPEEEMEWPETWPNGLVFLGCSCGLKSVHAVAWLDTEENKLTSPVFWHPSDPDAALLAALRYRE